MSETHPPPEIPGIRELERLLEEARRIHREMMSKLWTLRHAGDAAPPNKKA